jgi:hypothetical protein
VGGIAQDVRGRDADCKFIVAIAIEVLLPKGFGRVRLQHVNDVSGARITYDFFRTFDLSCSWEGWYKQEEQDL